MFPQNQAQSITSSNSLTMQPQVQQAGLSTELKQLYGSIDASRKLASELRSALGISNPETSSPQDPDTSIAASVRKMRYVLDEANSNLNDILAHLVS